MTNLGKWLLDGFTFAAQSLFAHRPEPVAATQEPVVIPDDLTCVRTDWIEPVGKGVERDLFGNAEPLMPPYTTRLEVIIAPERRAELEALAETTCQTLDDLPTEALGFLSWAVEMVREGRRIGRMVTHEGVEIIAIDPQNGTYVKADMLSFRNAMKQVGLPQPPAI